MPEVKWPFPAEMKEKRKNALEEQKRGTLLLGTFDVVVGRRFKFADCTDEDFQKAFYEK